MSSDVLRYLDEHQCIRQLLVTSMTFLSCQQLILTLTGHALQILPACTASEQDQNEHSSDKR